jgi:hypothetical protein
MFQICQKLNIGLSFILRLPLHSARAGPQHRPCGEPQFKHGFVAESALLDFDRELRRPTFGRFYQFIDF